MVFNATFNNISVNILWRSVLLVKETGVPRENHRYVTCHNIEYIKKVITQFTSRHKSKC